MFTGTYFKLGRRRMAGGLEVRLGWSAVPVPVSRLPTEFLNRCASAPHYALKLMSRDEPRNERGPPSNNLLTYLLTLKRGV